MGGSIKTRRGGAKREIKKTILIIGEGKSELSYFKDLKKENDLKFNLEPKLGSDGSNYKSIFEKVLENADLGVYAHIFCLIDLDYIIKQDLLEDYEKEKNILLSNTQEGLVIVIESLPCFELWILLHFEKTQSTNVECKQLIDGKVKKHINDYTKAMSGLYSKIKDKQPQAMEYSKEIKKQRQKEIENTSNTFCRLSFTDIGELIKYFVKDE
jgi:hypothetical protein